MSVGSTGDRAASTRLAGARILMSVDAVGGVWTYALDLAAGLARHGAVTRLIVLGPEPSSDQRTAAKAVPGLALIETGWPLDWLSDDPAAVLRTGASMAALARDEGATLVHLNSPALAASAAFAQPVLGICHSCVATWWDAVRDGPRPADFVWRTELVAAGYAACDALIAPSAAFARATASAYGIAEPIVVHNGRRLQAPVEPFDDGGFVFTAGRLWDEAKNLALLDEAAGRLDLPVLAAGPTRGPNGAQIDLRCIKAVGLLTETELAFHFAARPIFCSPALYEPFGLAVLEAAQAECALVLSDIPTFRELWDGAAVFVPPRDAAALAMAVESLASDSAQRRVLERAAFERAKTYSIEAMVEGTLAVYRRLLAGETVAASPRALVRAEPVS